MRGGRWGAITFPALAALIVHPQRGPILFDTGYAAHFMHATQPFPERLYRWMTPVSLPAGQTLAAQLRRFGFTLADIQVCLLSHFHADHIAGVRDLPQARFVCRAAGYQQFRHARRLRGLMQGLLPVLLPEDFPQRVGFAEDTPALSLPAPWQVFGHGHDLLGDGSVIGIPLPGHAAGQMGVLLRDHNGREVLLCADACWSQTALEQMRLPSLLARPLMDNWSAYRQTLGQLHLLSRQHPELVFLPSHCEVSLAAYQPGWNQSA